MGIELGLAAAEQGGRFVLGMGSRPPGGQRPRTCQPRRRPRRASASAAHGAWNAPSNFPPNDLSAAGEHARTLWHGFGVATYSAWKLWGVMPHMVKAKISDGSRVPMLCFPPDSFFGQAVRAEALPDLMRRQQVVVRCVSEFAMGLREMALIGQGAAWLPASLIQGDLARGTLAQATPGTCRPISSQDMTPPLCTRHQICWWC